MQRIRNLSQSILDAGGSAVDGNRLYSILLDARASKMSENMFDVAEGLLNDEKENAKAALERLWSLRKDLEQSGDVGTVDMLIRHYQGKLDVLRNKEENIKRVSKDSRALLEDKRKRDAEIASVKQEISDCSAEISRLQDKLGKLKVKEQELSLIEFQVKKELQANANEIINGLFEIILPQQSIDAGQGGQQPAPAEERDGTAVSGSAPATAPPAGNAESGECHIEVLAEQAQKSGNITAEDVVVYKHVETPVQPVFPKSVVKTTRGTVIGEYYYDPTVYKNKRHYIYNSNFLREQLSIAVRALKQAFDQDRFAEAVQMVQDAQKRIENSVNLHFEVSTNEVLNGRILKDMVVCLKARRYDDILGMCARLGAKIAALGNNYNEMLREQMKRCIE